VRAGRNRLLGRCSQPLCGDQRNVRGDPLARCRGMVPTAWRPARSSPHRRRNQRRLGVRPGGRRASRSQGLGVYHFSQIADWTPDEAVWVGHHIAFPGRIEREY
jgi:hypothetical protein